MTDGTSSQPQEMPPQKSLRAFLSTARAALTAPPSKRPAPLHFVVGNEAADLDSLCSTLLLAYFRSCAPPHVTHVPLCHLPRADLALRPEFDAVLGRAGVGGEDVLTLSELPKGIRPEDTRWLLVDHNVLTGRLGKEFGDRVVGCVDHHDDEGVVPKDADPRVIEKAGSCMSLVVEQCRETWDALTKGKGDGKGEGKGDLTKKAEINRQLAYLALAPILIDTANLGNKDKTTAHDERAVEIAEGYIVPSTSNAATTSSADVYDRAKFFAEVSALKEDISQMSARDVLRKDYKAWTEGALKLGTSSVPQSFATLIKQAGGESALLAELDRWIDENGLDVMVVLTTSKDDEGKFTRELMVWTRGLPHVVSAVKGFIEDEGKAELGLQAWGEGKLDMEDGEGNWRRCWRQERVEFSRKKIAPMLRDALKKV
ncbi:DHH phosphoesterase [Annulohypoxylon truncatum]|uniref:DHH phosphoesterase n=1 Tax=Annulohypoxylon truncatum TaxID=327061 RepID=UPI0020089A12|nr:DHH phosphoesterase [Annulohypoxylon truncatum]KAI1210903.1 DHH phosphoesterase [Annulohypoxylon truncatum]